MVKQALDQRESGTPVVSVAWQLGLDLAAEVLRACQALWEAVPDTQRWVLWMSLNLWLHNSWHLVVLDNSSLPLDFEHLVNSYQRKQPSLGSIESEAIRSEARGILGSSF